MWVMNGRALAPPCIRCSIGVSTSMNSRPSRKSRSAATAALRMCSISCAAGLMIRSTWRCRTRASGSAALGACRATGAGTWRSSVHSAASHRQLPAAAGDDLAADADVVAEVDVVPPAGSDVLAGPVGLEHDLDPAGSVLDGREAQPSRGRGSAPPGRRSPPSRRCGCRAAGPGGRPGPAAAVAVRANPTG